VNYRPICLLSHAYKAFAVILLRRLRRLVDAQIKCGQEGFRKGRGCRDNLFVLRAAIDFALKNHSSLELTFIDFTQAFDTVSHEFLQVALEEHGIPEKFRPLIGAIYRNAAGRIKGQNGHVSDPFPIRRGVLQGDILSPLLFVICLNSIWKRVASTKDGWQITPEWLLDELSYADDIALLDTQPTSSERRLQTLNDVAKSVAAMQISRPKTMRMMIGRKMQVGKTTEEDIAKLGLDKYKCPACDKGYDRKVSAVL
jgi:hypothetical protein